MNDAHRTTEASYGCGNCGKPITTGCYCSDTCANADERIGPLPVRLSPERLAYLKALAKEYMAAGRRQGLVELVAHIEALESFPPEPCAEPVATLHDDGHWTWTAHAPESMKHPSNYAGWRLPVFAHAPEPAAKPISDMESALMQQSTARLAAIQRLEHMRRKVFEKCWPASWLNSDEFDLRERLSAIYGLVSPSPETNGACAECGGSGILRDTDTNCGYSCPACSSANVSASDG